MKLTALHTAHKNLNAKMGEFAGYDMPLYYEAGVMAEHEWVRTQAGLFDVSHMGQIILEGPGAAQFWERITPSAFTKTRHGRAKYTVLTNKNGGIIDDLIITRLTDEKFYAVLNAGCKDNDIKWIKSHLPPSLSFEYLEEQALMALQGPAAQAIMFEEFGLDLDDMEYMTGQHVDLHGTKAFISRLGYTGEDGFELSVPAHKAAGIWNGILSHDQVKPIGLAARDSLRLEMGYCLYGHDIDETTTPVEADLQWIIGKENRDFIGAAIVRGQMETGPTRKRIGVKLLDKGVAREGTVLRDESGNEVGKLTSGGFSPTLKISVGQGYVDAAYSAAGTKIIADVRGRAIPAQVCRMPFVTAKTKIAKAA